MEKNLPANAGDTRDVGSIPGSGRSPEEGLATHSIHNPPGDGPVVFRPSAEVLVVANTPVDDLVVSKPTIDVCVVCITPDDGPVVPKLTREILVVLLNPSVDTVVPNLSADFPLVPDPVTISSSMGPSWPRGRTHTSCVSCIGRRILYH